MKIPRLDTMGLLAHTATYPDGPVPWRGLPGKHAPLLAKGSVVASEPGTDLVVELHLQPTGKHEKDQPTIGLFFTNDPPERTPGMLRLGRPELDIPAGKSRLHDYRLPSCCQWTWRCSRSSRTRTTVREHVLGDRPRCRTAPGKSLIDIPDWDFRWQQVYRFVDPVRLPTGTTIAMQYLYDNSADNPRNVTRPPQHVVWGQRSADEMGDLWFQVLTSAVGSRGPEGRVPAEGHR